MPGHKGLGFTCRSSGPSVPSISRKYSGLDDLHDPQGVLLEAEQLELRHGGLKEASFG